MNVAHWNLPERGLLACRLFHVSGYDPDRPTVLTKYSQRLTFDDLPAALPLFRSYGGAVLAAGWREEQERRYAFGQFDNGMPITDFARAAYRELGDEAGGFGDPFRTGGPDTFLHWLQEERREVGVDG